MRTITAVLAQRLIIPVILAGTAIPAPAFGILATEAATTVWAQGGQSPNERHRSITGARVGAPSEQQVSRYGGSHKHLWVRSSGMALGWLSSHTRLRYIAADKVWTLYWRDRDLRFTPATYSRHRGGSKTSSPRSTATPPASSRANPPSPARQRQFASPGPLRPTRWGRLGWTRRRCCQRKRGTRFGCPFLV
jgi:hypothetical protein